MPNQKADFAALFAEMRGLPVTIDCLTRLCTNFYRAPKTMFPPLLRHWKKVAAALRARIMAMTESNPMLGHRGSRLAVTTPEIYAMQLRAIFGALAEAGDAQKVEIMFPLIASARELASMLARWPIADAMGIAPEAYSLGAMIEVPRAALLRTDWPIKLTFSFGTNDLTQTTFGLSRDDAGAFLPTYVERHLLSADPFAQLTRMGSAP